MAGKRRDKGEGSVYRTSRKTKDGEIIYWAAKYKAPNMTKSKVKYGKTESEAKQLLRQMKHDAIKNDYNEIKKISVKEYMDNWLYTIMINELKPKSIDIKETILKNQVYPYIGDYQIANLKADDVQQMINSIKDKGLSYSTIKKAYDCVNACFKLGVAKKELIDNPCVGVKLPKNVKKKKSDIEYFEDDEIERICNACVMEYSNGVPVYRLGYAIIVLIYTGMRIGELLALEWKDIDFDSKSLKVRKSAVYVKNRAEDAKTKNILILQDSTKTNDSDRDIPLNKKAIAALNELKKINGKFDYVMATKTGQINNPRNIDRMFRNVLERCEIQPTGVHVLRHTFASLLFGKGVDVKTVSELLGHSNISITYDIYIHLINKQKSTAVELLDDL